MNLKTYNKSIDTLLNAYRDGRLEAGTCASCAVGTLLHETKSWSQLIDVTMCKLKRSGDGVIMTIDKHNMGLPSKQQSDEKFIQRSINEHGYTNDELCKIEYAFESSYNRAKFKDIVGDGKCAHFATAKSKFTFAEDYEDSNVDAWLHAGLKSVFKTLHGMVDDGVCAPDRTHELTHLAITKGVNLY